ncbi:hypothetical protein [Kitasatospora sp. NPDC005856]|uniref:maltokinase N-terminal cap-like domain-containing protein n=1 Tax=Kitasatospora sp. NPDC005856 TaxID=3154566 RepID=UPI0033E9072E
MTGLAEALAPWLPTQRWFAGKGLRMERVELVRSVEVTGSGSTAGPRLLLAVAAVRFANATGAAQVHRYQVPLGLRRGALPPELAPDLIVARNGTSVYDATGDRELMNAMLGLVAAGRELPGVRFSAERPDPLALPPGGLPVRRVEAEQSNTSVVFGERYILKLFRRLSAGTNPDLEVHRRLGARDDPHVATLLGSVDGESGAGRATLALVQSFVPGAVDGWRLATEAVRADPGGSPELDDELARLGGAVAAVHTSLAESFGTAALTRPRLTELRETLLGRLDDALGQAPVLAPHAPALRRLYHGLKVPAAGERIQRVHGDLHLGQVLRGPGGWLLIDFEGEPAAPIEQRVTWRSPLQDLAGLLRSLDYAAAQAVRTGGVDPAEAGRWADAAKAALRRGYGDVAEARRPLLRAYELDKAVYETVYEARNRPDWAEVPLGAIRDFAARAR